MPDVLYLEIVTKIGVCSGIHYLHFSIKHSSDSIFSQGVKGLEMKSLDSVCFTCSHFVNFQKRFIEYVVFKRNFTGNVPFLRVVDSFF